MFLSVLQVHVFRAHYIWFLLEEILICFTHIVFLNNEHSSTQVTRMKLKIIKFLGVSMGGTGTLWHTRDYAIELRVFFVFSFT